MDPPVPRKREFLNRAPIPTPRRSAPAGPPPAPSVRRYIKETATNASNKINESVMSCSKFAKDALEQSLPERRISQPTNDLRRVPSPHKINFQQNIRNSIQFEHINEQDEETENIYGNLLSVAQNSNPVLSRSTNNLNNVIKEELYENGSRKAVHLSLNNLNQLPDIDVNTDNLIELSNSTSYSNQIDTSRNITDEYSVVKRKQYNNTRNFNVTKSTILEFDPFAIDNAFNKTETKTNEKLLMESFLQDCYGESVIKMDDDLSENSENDFAIENSDLSPPTPPERNDSLAEGNSFHSMDQKTPESNSQWFFNDDNSEVASISENVQPEKKRTSGLTKKFSQIFKSVPDSALHLRPTLRSKSGIFSKKVDKPPLSKRLITHDGYMMRALSASIEELFKHFQDRYCFLSQQTLFCYADNNNQTVKEKYNLDSLYSVQVIKKQTSSTYHYFQLNMQTTKAFTNNRNTITFACRTSSDRSQWLMKIVESATSLFSSANVAKLTRFGWCFKKASMSQPWGSGWLLLCRRFLYYHTHDEKNVQTFDLRKARFVVLKNIEENANLNSEDGPTLILDFQGETLYLRMGCSAETKIWKKIIKSVAIDNGKGLADQQLTKDDIPTIVHKCINFISIYGSLSEGIYRRAGPLVNVNKLLEQFKNDAWEFNLLPSEFCGYAVATALKRFFRDLSEPLLPQKFHSDLYIASALKNTNDKITKYKNTLSLLPINNKNTLRALIGHLRFIDSLHSENFMNAENLASIWAPTLMPSMDPNENHHMSAAIINDLIANYVDIYNPTETEINKEKNVLKVLKKFHETSNVPITVKPSGEFHVWIHYGEDAPINILVNPSKTSGDVCDELCTKINVESHLLCLEEVICEECMHRPLHHTEIVLDIVSNWGAWDECDRKENFLRLRVNTFLKEIARTDLLSPLNTFKNKELKYADEKTKTFKIYTFDFIIDSLVCYKDKNANIVLESWNIKDIRWYIGHESKRNPQSEWSITFIRHKKKTSRSKGKPWFGNIIAGQNRNDFMLLISYFLESEYPGGLLPEPRLIYT